MAEEEPKQMTVMMMNGDICACEAEVELVTVL